MLGVLLDVLTSLRPDDVSGYTCRQKGKKHKFDIYVSQQVEQLINFIVLFKHIPVVVDRLFCYF